MSDCKCDDNVSKFFSNSLQTCEDKKEGNQYQNSNGECVDVEEVCEYPILKKTYPDIICPIIDIEDTEIKEILSLFYYLCNNINIINNLVKGLVKDDLKRSYEEDLLKLKSNTTRNLGRAKILAQDASINNQLANIYNIFGLVLYSELKDTDFYNNNLIEILADLGCSVGQGNIYFQDIEGKYNIDKFTEEEVNAYGLEKFIKIIINSIKKVIEEINSKKEEILSIRFHEGDEIGGNGSGSYNKKYHYYYLIRCLFTNSNIKELINTEELIDPEIKKKYNEINLKEKELELEFFKKYLKYKKKYTQLKANLIK